MPNQSRSGLFGRLAGPIGTRMSQRYPDCKCARGTEARKTLRRRSGFILLELLVALTVAAIAFSLFWQASQNRMRMLTKLEENYAFSRLTADVAILKASEKSIDLDPSHYSPLVLNITAAEILVTSKNFKTKKILRK